MKIITPALEVLDSDGFENDIFNRKEFGESLKNIVIRSQDELVLGINAPWGEGKTTFLKMWQGYLKEDNIHSIYIDSFKSDFSEEPFIAITSAIINYANEHVENTSEEKITAFIEKAAKAGSALIPWAAKLSVKALTLGLINNSEVDALKQVGSDLAVDSSNMTERLLSDSLKNAGVNKEILSSFRTLLSELPEVLSTSDKKPLVIIIDELDRCRPTYAVEILEKVKHLFSVHNVVFILAMHKQQLVRSIEDVYGQGIDAELYLQKFINIETALPKKSDPFQNKHNDIKTYIAKLYQVHELETWEDEEQLKQSIYVLAEHFKLSLRQLEKAFTYLSLYYSSVGESQFRLVHLIAALVVIKVVNSELYTEISSGRCSCKSIEEFFNYNEPNRTFEQIQNWIRWTFLSEEEFKELEDNDSVKELHNSVMFRFSSYMIKREEVLPYTIKALDQFSLSQSISFQGRPLT